MDKKVVSEYSWEKKGKKARLSGGRSLAAV